MKKAQGLSLNTIIIAAIVLIVLVVLWAIFTGRMGAFSTGLSKTNTCKNACKAIGRSGEFIDSEDRCETEAVKGRFLGKEFSWDDGTKLTNGCCCKP